MKWTDTDLRIWALPELGLRRCYFCHGILPAEYVSVPLPSLEFNGPREEVPAHHDEQLCEVLRAIRVEHGLNVGPDRAA